MRLIQLLTDCLLTMIPATNCAKLEIISENFLFYLAIPEAAV